MGFIEYLIEATSGASMWDKYYKGRRVMTTIKAPGADVYDEAGKKTGQKLATGQEVLVIGEYPLLPAPKPGDIKPNSDYDLRVGATDPEKAASRTYQQRNTANNVPVEHNARVKVAVYNGNKQIIVTVSLSQIEKPLEKKMFGYLKPQRVLKGQGKIVKSGDSSFAVFASKSEYLNALLKGINALPDASAEVKQYLTELAIVANAHKTTSHDLSQLYDQTGISNSAHAFGTLSNDFTEMLGPLMVTDVSGPISFPLKGNEAMIDFKIGDTGFSSKRAGSLANTLKCQHVIDALSPKLRDKVGGDVSFTLIETIAQSSIKGAPKALTEFIDSNLSKQLSAWMTDQGVTQTLRFGLFKGEKRKWLPPSADYSKNDNYNMQMTNIERFVNYLVLHQVLNFDQYVNFAFNSIRVVKMDINIKTGALQNFSAPAGGGEEPRKGVTIRYKGRPDERMGFALH
jgi:hypothetical protein